MNASVLTIAAIMAIITMAPLIITPRLLFHFDITPKIIVFLIGVGILLILCIWRWPADLFKFARSGMGKWFVLLLGAQLLWVVLATATSTHPFLSLEGSSWRRIGLPVEAALLVFTMLVAAWVAADPRRADSLLGAMTAAGFLASLYGIVQYFGVDPFQDPRSYQAGESPFTIVRPPGPIGHADYFAAWLLPIVFIPLVKTTRPRGRVLEMAGYFVSFLAIAAILLSGTRAAVLGLMIGAIVYMALGRVRVSLRAFGAFTLILVCCVVFAISPAGAKVRARIYWSSQDAFGGARFLLWRDSLRTIATRPFLGYGPETFATEFPRHQSVELARAYPDFYHESPHNIFLDVAVESGLPAAALLFGSIGIAIYAGCSVLESQRGRMAPLLAGLAAVFVCQQFVAFVLPTALSFYLLPALILGLSIVPDPRDPQVRLGLQWAARIAVIPCAILVTVFAIRLYNSDRAMERTRQFIASGDVRRASGSYAESVSWMPDDNGNDLYYSRAMALLASSSPAFGTRLEAFPEAYNSGLRAVRNAEDRQNAWYNLATLLAQKNDVAGVERCLRSAIAWAPNWFKPHWTLAQVLELSHHHSEALAEAAAAVERDGGKNPDVLATLKSLEAEGK